MSKSQWVRDGIQALRAGDAARAHALLLQALDSGVDDLNVFMGLAIAARALGRHEDSLAAVERFLSREPNDWRALIVKADALAAGGKERRASATYLKAVSAAPPENQLPPDARADLHRARQACAAAAVRYEDYLRAHVSDLGLFDGKGHTRCEQALDILFGRKQIYLQQPEKFYFPELPQVQFYEPAQFDWTQGLIAQTEAIRTELEGVLTGAERFEAYVPRDSSAPHLSSHALAGNLDWSAYHLFKDGLIQEENARLCPKTMAALKAAPTPSVPGKCPVALFSRLKPGTRIPPHHGLMNSRLICHLPLIAPEGCVLRVGNQERVWRIGEMLIFDDSIEHEAYNPTSKDRTVLLFDIWRPELSEDERRFISALFEAIEDFGVF